MNTPTVAASPQPATPAAGGSSQGAFALPDAATAASAPAMPAPGPTNAAPSASGIGMALDDARNLAAGPVLPAVLSQLGLDTAAVISGDAAALPVAPGQGQADPLPASDADESTMLATDALIDAAAFMQAQAPATASAATGSAPAAGLTLPAATGSAAAAGPMAAAAAAVVVAASTTASSSPAMPSAAAPAGVTSGAAAAPPADVAAAAVPDSGAAFVATLDKAAAGAVGPTSETAGPAPLPVADALPAGIGEVRSEPAARRPPVLPQVQMPADPESGFDQALGSRLTVMLEQGIGHARIRIAPEHLGAIDLKLSVEGDRVSAQFQSSHADVRTAIEAGMGRLREHLAEHGLQLAHGSVGGQQQGNANNQSRHAASAAGEPPGSAATGSAEGDSAPAPAAVPVRQVGLVDVYA
jgi:flagellar hook-length control protein FliK